MPKRAKILVKAQTLFTPGTPPRFPAPVAVAITKLKAIPPSGALAVANDSMSNIPIGSHGTVSYTHLTLPTNREV